MREAIVYLEDGTIFRGKSLGEPKTAVGEICFNTGMTGYQEIFTGPVLLWTNSSDDQCTSRKLWSK